MKNWRSLSMLLLLATILLLYSCASGPKISEPASISAEIHTIPQELVAAPGEPGPAADGQAPLAITWQTTAAQWRGMFGHRETVWLPPGGEKESFHGYGVFDFDSSIGSAAVSMGLITYEAGGIVTFEIKKGPEYTKGDDTYEGWNTIFVFLNEQGLEIRPEATTVLYIPDPEEAFQGPYAPTPEVFTITNRTGRGLTYLDIFTNDMKAVDEFGCNLLSEGMLEDYATEKIMFRDHPALEESILYRYGQLFHVFAEDALGDAYYRTWYPDFDSLELVLDPIHRIQAIDRTPAPPGTIRIENHTDYMIVDLFILTPTMEVALDFSIELLDGSSLPQGSAIDLLATELPYLDRHLSGELDEKLVILAFDEDDYMLEKPWSPVHETWTIVLTEDDYYLW